MRSPQAGFGPTVAFELVDGPPPQVFDRLVRVLDRESQARSFDRVARSRRPPTVCAAIFPPRSGAARRTIAWVWDVYDRDQQRALRLSGEEPAGKAGRDAWTAADDQMMRRIAQAGLSGLST